jgi:drug/metabolite transporter (DMT)-like permease
MFFIYGDMEHHKYLLGCPTTFRAGFGSWFYDAFVGSLVWLAFLSRAFARKNAYCISFWRKRRGLIVVPSFRDYADAPLGFVLGLTGGAGWALGTIVLKRGSVAVSASVLTGWQLLITALPCSIGAAWFGDWQWFVPSTQSLIVIAYITVVPILIGNVCWIAIVGLLPTQVAGLSAIAVPMVAMVSGALMHGEPLGLTQWLAMACTALALGLLLVKRSGASH